MNFLIFKLSRRQRFALALAFTIMDFLQIILGILTVGWSLYICISVSHNLYSEKSEITFVFTVTCMYGTHVIIHYLIGIKISEKCFNRAHKRSTKKQLVCWILAGCNIIFNILVVAILAKYVSAHIVRSMKHSLEKGMRYYLKDPEWKQMIDNLQVDFQCCGIGEYKDWHNISWLSTKHLNMQAETVQNLRLTKEMMHFPVTPWSCCKLDFPMQCLHDPFQQVQSAHLWRDQPDFVLESINSQGCLDVIKAPIEISLVAFTLVGSLIVILQICIIVISRLVYTSSRNAVVLRDPYGYSPGWIFGRNFCATQKNRTLSKIMLDLSTGEERMRLEKALEAQDTLTATTESKQQGGKGGAPQQSITTAYTKVPTFCYYATESGGHYRRNSVNAKRMPELYSYPLRFCPRPPPLPQIMMEDSARESEHDPISSAEEDMLMIRK